jgi:hypothetical protein
VNVVVDRLINTVVSLDGQVEEARKRMLKVNQQPRTYSISSHAHTQ